MINLNTNISSYLVQKALNNSTKLIDISIEQMSSGYKINHAKDNAANFSIIQDMTRRLSSWEVAEDNASMGINLVDTASSALELVNDKFSRLRALAMQISNGTYGKTSRKAINAEANAIIDDIERTFANTEYNGMKLFGGIQDIITKTEETESVSSTGKFTSMSAKTSTEDTSLFDVSKPGFVENITKRDTSAMTSLQSVDESTTISSGTYSISSVEELVKLADMTNKKQIRGGEFVLANDIDLSSIDNWTPIGYTNNSPFGGNFDGNGYVISNLTINSSSGFVGLFGSIYKESSIKNVGLENVNITATNGNVCVGGLVGDGTGKFGLLSASAQTSNASISNCYVDGTITSTDISANVGGLAGRNIGSVSNSAVFAKIITNPNSSIYNISGGVVGQCNSNNISLDNVYVLSPSNSVMNAKFIGNLGNRFDVTITNSTYNKDLSDLYDYYSDAAPKNLPKTECIMADMMSTPKDYTYSVIKENTSAMTSLQSVDINTTISSGTYSISTAEELVKLSEMTNAGYIQGGEFVLANNIDMSSIDNWTPIGTGEMFTGTFNGNGYVISNLTISIDHGVSAIGLFGIIKDAEIKNLGLENVNITASTDYSNVGGIAGTIYGSKITNCYVDGTITNNGFSGNTGGIVGCMSADGISGSSSIDSCSVGGKITATGNTGTNSTTNVMSIGGIVGTSNNYKGNSITGVVVLAEITAGADNYNAGGIVGSSYYDLTLTSATVYSPSTSVIKSKFVGNVGSGYDVKFIRLSYSDLDTLPDYTCHAGINSADTKGVNINNSSLDVIKYSPEFRPASPVNINLQVGINSKEPSVISFDMSFEMADLSMLRQIGAEDVDVDCIEGIDAILEKINAKQVELGSVQNRLESVFESITVHYDNLVASRSTLRDADIATVSSEYIKQQILQQASATLLATANQTPSIALQLI